MALDINFAHSFVDGLYASGWEAILPEGELPNPLFLVCQRNNEILRLIIHARRLTAQERSGENPSSHNRPSGELHAQMIFDGDRRGAGNKNTLRFLEGYYTLLLGFYGYNNDFVIAAYDSAHHNVYSYSKSLQLKKESIDRAITTGLTFQIRQSGETVVVFPIDAIDRYLEYIQELHKITEKDIREILQSNDTSLNTKKVFSVTVPKSHTLISQERIRIVQEVGRYIRDRKFEEAIKSVYDRCAICNFQYDYIIDAAHIIPVAKGGMDTYDNGLGLCPNCHRMYDKGLILVDGEGEIYINPFYAEKYDQIGRAGSLTQLQATLRKSLWLPINPQYHPSSVNLKQTFEVQRQLSN